MGEILNITRTVGGGDGDMWYFEIPSNIPLWRSKVIKKLLQLNFSVKKKEKSRLKKYGSNA